MRGCGGEEWRQNGRQEGREAGEDILGKLLLVNLEILLGVTRYLDPKHGWKITKVLHLKFSVQACFEVGNLGVAVAGDEEIVDIAGDVNLSRTGPLDVRVC